MDYYTSDDELNLLGFALKLVKHVQTLEKIIVNHAI